jgi:hypothetical protein
MTTKMRNQSWHDLPRQSRLARVLWPQLAEKQYQDEMQVMSKQEGKTSPLAAKGTEPSHRSWWQTGQSTAKPERR